MAIFKMRNIFRSMAFLLQKIFCVFFQAGFERKLWSEKISVYAQIIFIFYAHDASSGLKKKNKLF